VGDLSATSQKKKMIQRHRNWKKQIDFSIPEPEVTEVKRTQKAVKKAEDLFKRKA